MQLNILIVDQLNNSREAVWSLQAPNQEPVSQYSEENAGHSLVVCISCTTFLTGSSNYYYTLTIKIVASIKLVSTILAELKASIEVKVSGHLHCSLATLLTIQF